MLKVCGYIPNAGINQWPVQGNNPIFIKTQGSPTEPVITKTNGEEKKKRGKRDPKLIFTQANQQAYLQQYN